MTKFYCRIQRRMKSNETVAGKVYTNRLFTDKLQISIESENATLRYHPSLAALS